MITSKMAEGISSILLLSTSMSMVIGLSSGNLGCFIVFVFLELSDILLWLVQRDTEDISAFKDALSS